MVREPDSTSKWQTQWEALGPGLQDAPAETLPEADRLIEQLLAERRERRAP